MKITAREEKLESNRRALKRKQEILAYANEHNVSIEFARGYFDALAKTAADAKTEAAEAEFRKEQQAAKERAMREQILKEQTARMQAEQEAKKQTERAAKDRAAKEQTAKERAAKERAAKGWAAKERAAKERAAKDLWTCVACFGLFILLASLSLHLRVGH
jgi:hypothetical protein